MRMTSNQRAAMGKSTHYAYSFPPPTGGATNRSSPRFQKTRRSEYQSPASRARGSARSSRATAPCGRTPRKNCTSAVSINPRETSRASEACSASSSACPGERLRALEIEDECPQSRVVDDKSNVLQVSPIVGPQAHCLVKAGQRVREVLSIGVQPGDVAVYARLTGPVLEIAKFLEGTLIRLQRFLPVQALQLRAEKPE
jgi:hypothetical protein